MMNVFDLSFLIHIRMQECSNWVFGRAYNLQFTSGIINKVPQQEKDNLHTLWAIRSMLAARMSLEYVPMTSITISSKKCKTRLEI